MDSIGIARSRSLKPEVIQLSRHRPLRQSHVNQKHYLTRNKTGPHRTIHVTIRSQPSDSLSIANRNDPPMDLATAINGHRQNHMNKASFFANLAKGSRVTGNPSSSTPITACESATPQVMMSKNLPERFFLLTSNGNTWSPHREPYDPNYVPVKQFKSTSSTEIISSDVRENVRDGWPDWSIPYDKHHRHPKKRQQKKYSLPCVILFVIIGLLFLILATVLLTVLLTRKTTKVTTSRSAVLRWNSTGITIAGVTGQFGNGSHLLNVPFGLALDWSYTLFVADWSNHRVQRFLQNSTIGTTVAGQPTGSYNSTPNFFHYPGDVAVDEKNNVYVADTFNDRLQLWNAGSSTGVTVAGTGANGNASNQLNRPFALARDPHTGTLYIADTMNNRVMRYLFGTSSGDLVAGGHGSGMTSTQLNNPYGLYFDSLSNSLIIANGNANNIVRWTLGASSWTLLAGNMNGTGGNASTELNLAMDVTLDPMGNMYVVDRLNHRIQFFPMGDTHGTTIAGVTGISGTSAVNLNTPMSIALDGQLNLYVADAFNSRVQKFLRY